MAILLHHHIYVLVCLTNRTILSAELARFSSSSFTFFRSAIRSVTSARIHSERFFACSFNSSAVKPIASPPSVGRRLDFLPPDLFGRRRGAVVVVVVIDVVESLELLMSVVDVFVAVADDCDGSFSLSILAAVEGDGDVGGGSDSTVDAFVVSAASFGNGASLLTVYWGKIHRYRINNELVRFIWLN